MDISLISKNKKRVLTVVFVLLGILAIGGIASVFTLNYNNFLPSAPVILDDGKAVLITTSVNENYLGYRFKFASTSGDVLIDSETNALNLEDLEESGLVLGTRYRVSVCYLAETEASSTQYSDSVTWVYSSTLDKPVIEIDKNRKIISWSQVENADYYVIHYKDGIAYKNQSVNSLTFDYSNSVGGTKEFYVVAHSNEDSYRCSQPSEKLVFLHKYEMKEIKEVSFNKANYYLTIKAQEKIDYLTIYIGGEEHIAKLSNYTLVEGLYQYKINIVTKYQENARIGVAPSPPNEYYTYNGQILYVQ